MNLPSYKSIVLKELKLYHHPIKLDIATKDKKLLVPFKFNPH
jgi:hypothetical protein